MRISSHYKRLLLNVFLFAISSFSAKIMSFVILPLYTQYISDAEYAVIDLATTIVNLLVPLLSICISDFLLKSVLENPSRAKKLFSLSSFILVASSIVAFALFPILNLIDSIQGKAIFISIGYFLTLSTLMFSYMLRATNKTVVMAVASLLSAIISIALNYVWANNYALSINSYFICLYSGMIVGVFTLFIFGKLYAFIGVPRTTKNEIIEIRRFCLPLVPNSIFWWINSCVDRFSIIYIVGMGMTGIYSAASKLPSLLTIFSTIFQQAWNVLIFAKVDKESKAIRRNMYHYYHCALLMGGVVIIVFTHFISKVLLKEGFFQGWVIVPILVVSFVFSTLSTFIGSYFTASKNTKPLLVTSLISAIVNLILNVILINVLGVLGAAIATCVSSAVNYYLRVFLVKRTGYIKKTFSPHYTFVFCFMIILCLSYPYYNHIVIQAVLSIVLIILIVAFLLWFICTQREHSNEEESYGIS